MPAKASFFIVIGSLVVGPPLSLFSNAIGLMPKAGSLIMQVASFVLFIGCYRNFNKPWGKICLPFCSLVWLLSLGFSYVPG